jgi:hypothetical protein
MLNLLIFFLLIKLYTKDIMEFLKIKYIILEIYPKGEQSSGDEDINDNSQFVNMAEIILEENPDILSEDLSMFVDTIKKIFNNKSEIIKNILKISYDENALKEFDECFIDDNCLNKINSFIVKYNINQENAKIFGVLFNILTITDYIITNVSSIESMNIVRLVM